MPVYNIFHKNIKQQKQFYNINNNQKCVFSTKSAYYHDFWRIMWPWSNDAENSALPSNK